MISNSLILTSIVYDRMPAEREIYRERGIERERTKRERERTERERERTERDTLINRLGSHKLNTIIPFSTS